MARKRASKTKPPKRRKKSNLEFLTKKLYKIYSHEKYFICDTLNK
jgi:hypothetical protein